MYLGFVDWAGAHPAVLELHHVHHPESNFPLSVAVSWGPAHTEAMTLLVNCHHQVWGTPAEKTATVGLRRMVGDHHPVGVVPQGNHQLLPQRLLHCSMVCFGC